MNPVSLWTELAFKLWGFGKPAAPADKAERQVAVAVIPTSDAQSPPPGKAARQHGKAKAKARSKGKGRRTRR